MAKFVVYTVIVGGYDEVTQPSVIDERFDYVLFSDTHKEAYIGVWRVQPVPYESDLKYKKARYPRLQPEKVLPNYDAWLYVDGNIQITSQWVYDRCVELYERGVEWASVKHLWRDSIYEEIDWMIKAGWVHDYSILPWYKYLQEESYPHQLSSNQNFLYETGIIFRKKTDNVKKVNDIWWWSIENYVKRDQFSLMYALWKVPEIKTDFFLPEGENAWTNEGHFKYANHNPHTRVLPQSAWEKMRHRCFRAAYGEDASYTILLDKVCRHKHPMRMMHLWTAYAIVRYGYKVVIEMIKCRLPKRK